MKCTYPEEQVALFIEGDLAARGHREVERHLVVCPECRVLAAELRESQALWKSLRGETVRSETLRAFRECVLDRIRDAEASLGWALRLERVVFAGFRRQYVIAAVVVLVSGLVMAAAWSSGRIPGPAFPEPVRVAEADTSSRLSTMLPTEEVEAPVPEIRPEDLEFALPATLTRPERVRTVKLPIRREIPTVAVATLTADRLAPFELPNAEPDQILVKMLTDDPDIVIYWVVDEGDPKRSE